MIRAVLNFNVKWVLVCETAGHHMDVTETKKQNKKQKKGLNGEEHLSMV